MSRRVILGVLIGAVLLLATGVTVLRLRFHGPELARLVQKELNARIRGRVEIGSIEWPMRAIPAAVVGSWVPITIRDLVVYDERNEIVLKTPRATAKLDPHAAMFGKHDMVLRDIQIEGGYVLLEEITEPFPVHETDTHVVSIVSAFYSNTLDRSFSVGLSAHRAIRYDLRSLSARDVTIDFVFPEIETIGRFEGVHLSGFLFSDLSDPLAYTMYYALDGGADRGYIEALGYRTELHDIELRKLRQLPTAWPRSNKAEDIEWEATALATHASWARIARPPAPARLAIRGAMREWWSDYYGGEYDVKMLIENAGPLVRSLSPDGIAGGKNLSIQLDITGPVLRAKYNVALYGLEVDPELSKNASPMKLRIDRLAAAWDMATEQGYIEDTVAKGAGGEIQVSASFGVNPLLFDVYLNFPKPINLAPYVDMPEQVKRHVGTRLSGRMHAFGNQDLQRIDKIDLHLGRAHLEGKLYRQVGEGEVIHTERLDVTLGKTVIRSRRGWLDYGNETFDQKLTFHSADLGQWLRKLELPPLAKKVENGNAWVGGKFTDPRATASFALTGVPIVERVDNTLTYEDQLIHLRHASANALSGSLLASGRVRLGNYSRVLGFDARAKRLDLTRLPVIGKVIGGLASAHVHASGPAKRISATLVGCVDGLTIAGDRYSNFKVIGSQLPSGDQTITLGVDRNRPDQVHATGPSCAASGLDARKPGGLPLPNPDNAGHLQLTAKLDTAGAISGKLSLNRLPIETLSVLDPGDGKPRAGGALAAELQLSGSAIAPQATGQISLTKGWYRTAYLGQGGIRVTPEGKRAVKLDGSFFGGMVELAGIVGTVPPYSVDTTVRFRRVELDRLAPELASAYGARGWASGSIRVRSSLLGGGKPHADVHLSELELVMRGVDAQGRPAPLRLYNATPVEIAYDGVTARLKKPVTFRGPAGDFVVSGSGSPERVSVDIEGLLAVNMLTPYFRDYFESMFGTVKAKISLRGKLSQLALAADIDFDPQWDPKKRAVGVRPVGQDAVVTIPVGRVRISNTQVEVTGLELRVTDDYTKESSTLSVAGNITMKDVVTTGGFVATRWGLRASGDLAGKMLLVAAPRSFSAAGGAAVLSVSLGGNGRYPTISGSLSFARPGVCRNNDECSTNDDCAGVGDGVCTFRGQPLSLTPRGLRRDITFTSGEINFSDRRFTFDHVSFLFDNEGRITLRNGDISLAGWGLDKIDVTLSASAVPFRIPKVLDLSLSASGVRIYKRPGRDEKLQIGGGGRVEIVDGRYTKDHLRVQHAFKPAESSGSSKPFYAGVPLLANAALDLQLRTQSFAVRNNMANISLTGGVRVSGTLAEPRFGGTIRVEEGRIKVQGVRVAFTRTSGTVGFSSLRSFPDDTPILRIRSEADYRDASGQDHLVTAEIKGPLSNFELDLYTSSGLNKAQTFALLTLGRSTDDIRSSLGDDAVARDPTRIDPSTQAGTNTVYDQLVKDLAGDFISLLLEDKLRNLTGLDVARLSIGTSSIAFHGEKNLLKNFKLIGDWERTLRGMTLDGRVQLRLTGGSSVQVQGLKKSFDDSTEDDITDGRVRLVFRVPIL